MLTRKFGWDQERTIRAISVIQNASTIVEPPRLGEVIEGGHAGNRILECAAAANADYLVTGDRKHLLPLGGHQDASIVTSPRFLSGLGQGQSVGSPRNSP